VKIGAVIVALLGFAAGFVFRLSFLIAVLVFLLFVSIGYSIAHHCGILTATLTVVGVQVLAQVSFFWDWSRAPSRVVGEPNLKPQTGSKLFPATPVFCSIAMTRVLD
jgi:hypothetical protein